MTNPLRRVPPLAAALLALAGCGGDPTGSVSGTVTLDGKPVKAGAVTLLVAGVSYSADIQDGGRYALAEVPVGEAIVLVLDPPGEMAAVQLDKEQMELIRLGKMAPPKSKPPVVPQHYADQTRTPLKTTVNSGANTYDIAMKK